LIAKINLEKLEKENRIQFSFDFYQDFHNRGIDIDIVDVDVMPWALNIARINFIDEYSDL
jgi:hypothetical protein